MNLDTEGTDQGFGHLSAGCRRWECQHWEPLAKCPSHPLLISRRGQWACTKCNGGYGAVSLSFECLAACKATDIRRDLDLCERLVAEQDLPAVLAYVSNATPLIVLTWMDLPELQDSLLKRSYESWPQLSRSAGCAAAAQAAAQVYHLAISGGFMYNGPRNKLKGGIRHEGLPESCCSRRAGDRICHAGDRVSPRNSAGGAALRIPRVGLRAGQLRSRCRRRVLPAGSRMTRTSHPSAPTRRAST